MHKAFGLSSFLRLIAFGPLHCEVRGFFMLGMAKQMGQILAGLETAARRCSKGAMRNSMQPVDGRTCLKCHVVNWSCMLSKS